MTSAVAVSFDLSARKRLEAEAAVVDARLTGELDALARMESVRALTMTPKNRWAVLHEVLDTAIAINQADLGMLQLSDGGRLVTVAQRGFDRSYVESCDTAQGQGSWSEAVKAAIRVDVEDVTRSPLFVNTPALDAQLKAGVRSVQSVPLITRAGTILGVLSTHFREPHRADARRARVYDLLAREVAEIIERGASGQAVQSVLDPSPDGDR